VRNKTLYEWTCEQLDEFGDIQNSDFGDKLSDVKDFGKGEPLQRAIALVKNVGNDDDGLVERTWAYITEEGKLPELFINQDRVPKRFHKELDN